MPININLLPVNINLNINLIYSFRNETPIKKVFSFGKLSSDNLFRFAQENKALSYLLECYHREMVNFLKLKKNEVRCNLMLLLEKKGDLRLKICRTNRAARYGQCEIDYMWPKYKGCCGSAWADKVLWIFNNQLFIKSGGLRQGEERECFKDTHWVISIPIYSHLKKGLRFFGVLNTDTLSDCSILSNIVSGIVPDEEITQISITYALIFSYLCESLNLFYIIEDE